MPPAHTTDYRGAGAVYETDTTTVRVRQRRIDPDRRALEYAVATTGEETATISVRQPLPASVDLDDLGFPGDCGEDWERDGETLVFEAELAPDATIQTAWGVDGEFGADLEPPVVESTPASGEGATAATDAVDGAAVATEHAGPEQSDADPSDAELTDDRSDPDATGASLDVDLPPSDGDGGEHAGRDRSTEAGSDAEPAQTTTANDGVDDETTVDDADAADADLTRGLEAAVDLGSESADQQVGAASGNDAAFGAIDDELVPASDQMATGPDAPDADAAAGSADGTDEPDASATPESTRRASRSNDGDPPGATDSVVHELVAELHGDELDEAHRTALADALEVRLSDSTNAFVEHLREKQRRRIERVGDDVEALEASVEELYGVTADASDVDALGRAIRRLDDAKTDDDDLRELRSRLETLAETAADRDDVEALRADHETIDGTVEQVEDRLDALDAGHEALAETVVEEDAHEALADEVERLADDVDDIGGNAATAERLDAVAEDLATLRDAAATEAALADLEATVEALETDAATTDDVAALREELGATERAVVDRIALLEDRHEELAADAATTAALESLRADARDRHNETLSAVAALREELETEYSTDDAFDREIDRRVHRSVGHLLGFGIGTVGLAATIPLAIAGSPAAAVTFLGGAGVLAGWYRSVGSDGLENGSGPSSLRERLG